MLNAGTGRVVVAGAEKELKLRIEELQLRKEASRLVSMANKRARRMEKYDLTDAPVYKKYFGDNPEKHFSIRGMTNEEVKAEIVRMTKFIESKTSTIRGMTKHLKEKAQLIGIPDASPAELLKHSSAFFQIASKVDELYRHIMSTNEAIPYHLTWGAINTYIQEEKIEMNDLESQIDKVAQAVAEELKKYKERSDIVTRPRRLVWTGGGGGNPTL